jgi:hypothetical protein
MTINTNRANSRRFTSAGNRRFDCCRQSSIRSIHARQFFASRTRADSSGCASCHLQPNVGGSSPAQNPLIAVAASDGGVHNLFVVTGRADAGTCNITQPSFLPAGNPLSGRGGGEDPGGCAGSCQRHSRRQHEFERQRRHHYPL